MAGFQKKKKEYAKFFVFVFFFPCLFSEQNAVSSHVILVCTLSHCITITHLFSFSIQQIMLSEQVTPQGSGDGAARGRKGRGGEGGVGSRSTVDRGPEMKPIRTARGRQGGFLPDADVFDRSLN